MRQIRFIEEYLVDLNATQAAVRAGYNLKSAGKSASENLKKPAVRARIDKAMADLSRRTGVSQERVIAELSRVAFAEFDQAEGGTGLNNIPNGGEKEPNRSGKAGDPAVLKNEGETADCQQSGKSNSRQDSAPKTSCRNRAAPAGGKSGKCAPREVRLGDKLKALELLGKHLGMFGDRAQGMSDKVPQIIDDIGGRDET